MNIAVIGSGRLGTALGGRLNRLGHGVTYASRSSATAEQAAAATPGAHAADARRAVEGSDLAVLAVPYSAIDAALDQAGSFGGRILWSCVNALKADYSGLAVGFDTSAAEQVAIRAVDARVVAALPPFAERIASGRLDFDGRVPSVFCCSDDPAAKATLAELLLQLETEPIDAGPLSAARLVEPAMMLLVTLAYSSSPPRNVGLALLEDTAAGVGDGDSA